MDTNYVTNAIRGYGRARRTRQPAAAVAMALARALEAIAETGAGITLRDLERYGDESVQAGDMILDMEDRHAAGGRAIQIIASMEKLIRARLGETPHSYPAPPEPPHRTERNPPWHTRS